MPRSVMAASASVARPSPASERDGEVADAMPPTPLSRRLGRAWSRDAFRQPAQAEQQQNRRDRLDDDLRQREIGRGEPDEADAGDETRAPEQDQRRQPMEFGLDAAADRAADAHHPEQSKDEVEFPP